MFGDILGHFRDMSLENMVPVQIAHLSTILDPDFVLKDIEFQHKPIISALPWHSGPSGQGQ